MHDSIVRPTDVPYRVTDIWKSQPQREGDGQQEEEDGLLTWRLGPLERQRFTFSFLFSSVHHTFISPRIFGKPWCRGRYRLGEAHRVN